MRKDIEITVRKIIIDHVLSILKKDKFFKNCNGKDVKYAGCVILDNSIICPIKEGMDLKLSQLTIMKFGAEFVINRPSDLGTLYGRETPILEAIEKFNKQNEQKITKFIDSKFNEFII